MDKMNNVETQANYYLQKITDYISKIIPQGIDWTDIFYRIVFVLIVVAVFVILQGFEGKQRSFMRKLLESYKNSGLVAFKSVWDDLDSKNEKHRLKQYVFFAALIGTLLALSLFVKINVSKAVIFGVIIGFLMYPIELHFILRWFYNNKTFPVSRNNVIHIASLSLFSIFFIMSVIVIGNTYFQYVGRYLFLRYIILALFVAGIIIGLAMLKNLFRSVVQPDKPLKRELDSSLLYAFYIIPVVTSIALYLDGRIAIHLTRPVSDTLHRLVFIPEILFPVLCVICLFFWTAANSYLGKPLNTEAGSMKERKEGVREDSDAVQEAANPFIGEE